MDVTKILYYMRIILSIIMPFVITIARAFEMLSARTKQISEAPH